MSILMSPVSLSGGKAAELLRHGDIAVYTSPSRGLVWFVSAYRPIEIKLPATLTVATREFPTSEALAEALADLPPEEGDTHEYVHSECQKREDPCMPCTPIISGRTPPDYKGGVPTDDGKNFAQCVRIKRLETKCKEEYKVICKEYTYEDEKCERKKSETETPKLIYAWVCVPAH